MCVVGIPAHVHTSVHSTRISSQALLRRGFANEALGRMRAALGDMDAALARGANSEASLAKRRLEGAVVQDTLVAVQEAKAQGNKHFKEKKLQEAADKYSGALELFFGQLSERAQRRKECKVLASQLLTNRALVRLQLKQYTQAKADCDEVLVVVGADNATATKDAHKDVAGSTAEQARATRSKAYFRRGLANKGLELYAAAAEDLTQALKWGDSSSSAQMKAELAKVVALLKPKAAAPQARPQPPVQAQAAAAGKSHVKKPVIEVLHEEPAVTSAPKPKSHRGPIIEVIESDEEEEEEKMPEPATAPVADKPARTASPATAPAAAAVPVAAPKNYTEFGRTMRRLEKDADAVRQYIQLLEPKSLPVLFKRQGSLPPEYLESMLVALHGSHASDDPAWLLAFLTQLSKTARFGLSVMLFSSVTLKAVKAVFAYLQASAGVDKAKVVALQKLYA